MNLTDAEIKAAIKKTIVKRYQLRDGGGLSLDLLPSGVKSWVFRYYSNGKQERVTLGKYPVVSLAKAREKRDRLAVQVVDGKSPAQEKKLQRAGLSTNPTVRAFADLYFDEQVKPKLRKGPAAEVRRYSDKEVLPALGGRLLKDVSIEEAVKNSFSRRRTRRNTSSRRCICVSF